MADKQDNTTDKASGNQVDKLIELALADLGKTSSHNELTRIGWLVHGLDLWHRTDGKFGFSKDDATRYVISSVAHLLNDTQVNDMLATDQDTKKGTL